MKPQTTHIHLRKGRESVLLWLISVAR